MLELVTSHLWSLIRTNGPPEEVEEAAAALTVTNPAYFQAMKRRFFSVSKKISFFKEGMNTFPTGLVPLLTRRLEAKGIKLECVSSDLAPIPAKRRPKVGMFEGITLNEEQMRVVNAMLDAPVPRGYLKAHPNFGKTEVMFAIYFCLRPCLAFLIVTRSGLKEQAMKRCLTRLGEEPYVLGVSKGPLPKKGLIISTYHTLHGLLYGRAARRNREAKAPDQQLLALAQKADVVFGDEIHRSTAPMYSESLQAIEADRRYGFSATPMKSNNAVRNMMVRGWIGEQLCQVNLKKQVEKGRLAKAHVFFRTIGKGDPVAFSEMLNYHHAFMRAYMTYKPFLKHVLRDALWFYKHDLPCVILVDWVKPVATFHRLLSRMMPQAHVEMMHGELTPAEREAVKQRFEQGISKVLVATTGVLGEGEDLQKVSGLVLACPGRDPGVLYQRIGRGLRIKLGRANVLYVVSYLNLRHRYFVGHAKEHLKYYETHQQLYELHGESPLEVVDAPHGEHRE